MVEKPIATPIWGELLPENGRAEDAAHGGAPANAIDVIDADFVALSDRPAQAPLAGAPLCPLAAAPAGLEMLRGDGAANMDPGKRAPWAALVITAAAAAFWVSGGHALLERPGPAAGQGAALGIAKLKSRLEHTAGGDLLVIEGEAVNDGGAPGPLPDLSINMLGADGRVLHYFLGTNGTALSAGERFAFSSRVAAPKEGVTSVSVTFRE